MPKDLQRLTTEPAFAAWLRTLFRHEWVVYAKPPFGGPSHVLHYLARSTHRVAWVTDQTGYMGDTLVTGSGFFCRSSPRIMIGLWEWGISRLLRDFQVPVGTVLWFP